MYKVKQSDLIGDVKDFPIEVVQKMIEEQVRQGYKANVTMFQNGKADGFSWLDSPDGVDFWSRVIYEKNFDLFFQKYPKQKGAFEIIDMSRLEFAKHLTESGPYGVKGVSPCEQYGMTDGCDTECPVLRAGKCEFQETDNKELYKKMIEGEKLL